MTFDSFCLRSTLFASSACPNHYIFDSNSESSNTTPKSANMNSEKAPVKIRKFNRFRKLPPELRLKIWGFANDNNPRIIKSEWENQSLTGPQIHLNRGGKVPVPGVLHACRESRIHGLKRFSFVHKVRRVRGNAVSRNTKIFVNFFVDTFYFLRGEGMSPIGDYADWLNEITIDCDMKRFGDRSKVVRNIAFEPLESRNLLGRGYLDRYTAGLYRLMDNNQSLSSVSILYDFACFRKSPKSHLFTCKPPGTSTGYKYRPVSQANELVARFFNDEFKGSAADKVLWETSMAQRGPDWSRPDLNVYKLDKSRRERKEKAVGAKVLEVGG